MQFSHLAKSFGRVLRDNTPLILTGVSVAGLVTTVGMAATATYKAAPQIEKLREEDRKPLEIVKEVYKLYIPTAVMGVVTVGCIVGAHSVHSRRNAALVSVYSLTESAFKEYKSKVVEQIGEKESDKILDEVAKDRIVNNPYKGTEVLMTGRGEQLCYDMLSGRYFMSDVETIRQAQNTINEEVLNNFYASLNDFYNQLGLEQTKMGDELGWNTSNMLSIHFSSHLTPEKTACLAVDYRYSPQRGYDRFY